jgi:hypothetical protein
MLAVVVSTSSYLDFISYVVMLASLHTIGLERRRMSSCIVSWIWSGVLLDFGSVGCMVGSIASNIGRGVCWSISRRLAGALATTLAAGLAGFTNHFCLNLLQPPSRGDPGYDVAGEDAPIFFWSKNLLRICCIRSLFLRSEQRRRGLLHRDVRPLGNLRGDLERQELLPSWFAANYKLRVHHTRSP